MKIAVLDDNPNALHNTRHDLFGPYAAPYDSRVHG